MASFRRCLLTKADFPRHNSSGLRIGHWRSADSNCMTEQCGKGLLMKFRPVIERSKDDNDDDH